MTPSPPPAPARDELDRARGALLGTFVGDALGMPYEGLHAAAVPERAEMVEARLGRGTYTDDTEMMIALAESLVEHGLVDEPRLAQAFLCVCDPARGYGAGTLELFERWRRGVPVEHAAGQLFDGQGSLGNGAAMRIAPVAVRFAGDAERLRAQARRSAALTHAHPVAIDAAVVQAEAVGAALRGDDVLEAASAAAATDALRERLADAVRLLEAGVTPDGAAAALGSSALGHESVPTAIVAALAGADFEAAARFAIGCGGDTDTIGAMAGAIAGARDGASAIPSRWIEALEDGERGRRHVEALAGALAGAG